MTHLQSHLSKFLKAVRAKFDMSAEDFADKKLPWGYFSLRNWERGYKTMSTTSLVEFARASGADSLEIVLRFPDGDEVREPLYLVEEES